MARAKAGIVAALGLLAVAAAGCRRPDFAPVANEEGSLVPAPPPTERPPELTLGAAFTAAELRGFAGGMLDAASLGAGCVGQIPLGAQHLIEVRDPVALTLAAVPEGAGFMDLALAVRSPDGATRCADDGDGLNPVLALELAPGRHEILVAALSPETPPYRLSLRAGLHPPRPVVIGTQLPAPLPDGPPPEPLAEGNHGGLRLGRGTGPSTLEGLAGGTARARDLGHDCDGFVAPAPDHVLEVTAAETLTIRVASEADTTLVVLGPNGLVWCRDDVEGLQPGLREDFPPGRYAVYVGNWEDGVVAPYRLTVSR